MPATIGYTPAQIRHAYGFDAVVFDDHGVSIPGDGRGETIALFESGYDPSLLYNLAVFDRAFGLPDPTLWGQGEAQPSGPSIRVIGVDGTLPPAGVRETEAILDVEWVHAVAPGANILVVDGANDSQLTEADAVAARMPGVVVVSNSYSTYNYLEPPQEVADNAAYTTPPGHPGVTFVDSSGDTGAPSHPPDFSPFVLSVGGTSLALGADGGYGEETAWGASGGGISVYQKRPAYQDGVLPREILGRGVPDVSILGDKATGVAAYDPIEGGWHRGGGTSLSAPLWAAIIAIADQGRALRGLGPLDGATQTIPDLYRLPRRDFHDITVGNNGYAARPGYDLVTGRGSPYVDRVVAGLVASTASDPSPSLGASRCRRRLRTTPRRPGRSARPPAARSTVSSRPSGSTCLQRRWATSSPRSIGATVLRPTRPRSCSSRSAGASSRSAPSPAAPARHSPRRGSIRSTPG